MGEMRIEKGDIIYREGDVTDYAYFVLSGKVELVEINQGKAIPIRIIEAGKTFGEYAIFDPKTLRPFTARAMEQTVLITITEEEFQSIFSQIPSPAQPFFAVAFEKMKSTKVKEKSSVVGVLESDIKKIIISPEDETLKAQITPVEFPLNRLPFRIGGYPEGSERSRNDHLHLSIRCQTNPLRVSRQHCEICIEDKTLVVVDLGSRFCTTVNDITIGRGRGKSLAPLQKGDNHVILGASDSPYKLKVTCV